ncbi:MAG: DUF2637 domain-containing protein [Sciscionella sp.]
MTGIRRVTDGVIFQAVLTGSLSFSHIHDLAAAHGQAGWKAWLYPLSVDLLTVAAYRKLTTARSAEAPAGLAWCAFLLGLAASLAANILGAWQNPDRLVAVALGVWPAVAFLVCTLLTHDPTPAPVSAQPAEVPAPAPVAVPVPADPTPAALPVPARVEPSPAPAPAPASAPVEVERPQLSPRFLAWARRIADQHQTDTGHPIDLATLRTRLKVNDALAQTVHAHLTAGA